MLNAITLIGRLVRDPELRYLPNGTPVAQFPLAVGRPFSNAQGQKETDFFDIVAWRKLAETVANHLQKGRLVAVQGRLQSRSYDTPEGQRRKVFEIIAEHVAFLDRKPDENSMGTEVQDDEDLPFDDGDAA